MKKNLQEWIDGHTTGLFYFDWLQSYIVHTLEIAHDWFTNVKKKKRYSESYFNSKIYFNL